MKLKLWVLLILVGITCCVDYESDEIDNDIPIEVPMIKEMRKSTKKGLEAERAKTMDRQTMFFMF